MNTIINNPNTIIIILCTLPDDNKTLTLKLIQTLLNAKLAACITLLNQSHSFYHWNHKFETQIESQLLIKTKNSLRKSIFNKIKELHPYKIPELLVIPIITGELNYLNWIHASVLHNPTSES